MPTVVDTLKERGSQDLKADFFIATGPDGIVIARSDRPGGNGEDLSKDPVVMRPLESGEESATVWRQGDRLFHAVSVPMVTGPDLKGVLIAGYGINEALAGDIRKLTRSEIAYLTHAPGQPPKLSVSSLGPREGALSAALGRPELAAAADQAEPFELDLAGERYVAVSVPLKAATGEIVGAWSRCAAWPSRRPPSGSSATAWWSSRWCDGAGAGRRLLRGVAHHGPGAAAGGLVERARDGKFTGKVAVDGSDEIGVLARTFNKLLADLREKEQMIGFLREGMTMLKKGAGVTSDAEWGTAITASLKPLLPGDQTIGEGSVFADRYEILGNIGKGGMGVVFRARDRRLDEEVALKVLRSEALAEDPALVGPLQAGDQAGAPDHAPERPAHPRLRRVARPALHLDGVPGGRHPQGPGAQQGRAAAGRRAAHRQAGVPGARSGARGGRRAPRHQAAEHADPARDRRPQDHGLRHRARLRGAARRSDPALTMAGTVMGTPDYMSPEQASGTPADFRSDIYSLGVVLFEIFTGQLPFTGEKVMAVILAHIQKPPPLPRRLNPADAGRAGSHHPALPRQEPPQALPEDRRRPGGAVERLGGRRGRLT